MNISYYLGQSSYLGRNSYSNLYAYLNRQALNVKDVIIVVVENLPFVSIFQIFAIRVDLPLEIKVLWSSLINIWKNGGFIMVQSLF